MDEIKEAAGCLVWVVLFFAIVAVISIGPTLINKLQEWVTAL